MKKKEKSSKEGREYTKTCQCRAWLVSNVLLMEGLTIAHKGTGWTYNGRQFKYCPWCSKKLLKLYFPKTETPKIDVKEEQVA